MDDKNSDKVTDAEIVEENTASVDSGTTISPLDELQNIQNLINANIVKIDNLEKEVKPIAEMVESLLDADLEYAELDQKAREAAKEKMARKKELVSTANGRELQEKLKNLKTEIKEAKDALSDYLQEYQQKTGFREYEGPDGELRQIVFTAKLVRKTKLNTE